MKFNLNKSLLILFLFAFSNLPVSFSQTPYLIKDVSSEEGSSIDLNPTNKFATFKGKVYFKGLINFYDSYVYVTDGTTGNATRFADNIIKDKIVRLISTENKLFVFTEKDLYASDGTPTGTTKLTNIANLKVTSVFGLDKNRIVFTAKNTPSPDTTTISQLWVSDGTTTGTTLLGSDFNFGTVDISELNFTYFKNQIIILRDRGRAGSILISDGTKNGTKPITSLLDTIQKFKTINSVVGFEDQLVITGDVETNGLTSSKGIVTNGTRLGTANIDGFRSVYKVNKINDSIFTIMRSNSIEFYNIKTKTIKDLGIHNGLNDYTTPIVYNGKIYYWDFIFTPNSRFNCYLWESDGTVAGTKQITKKETLARYDMMQIRSGDTIFYIVSPNILRMVDLKTKIEKDVIEVDPCTGCIISPILTIANNKLIFSKRTTELGVELWALNLKITNNLNDLLIPMDVKAYPNPAKNNLNVVIEKNEKVNFIITNTMGHIVKSGIINENNTIDLEELSTGLYFISVKTRNRIGNAKFIKE